MHCIVVAPVGERLGAASRAARAGATGALALVMLLGKAMIGPLFSQSAWNNVTFTGGEVRDPGRTLPRALLIGCGVVVTSLPAGERRLRRHAPARRNPERAAGPRGGAAMKACSDRRARS